MSVSVYAVIPTEALPVANPVDLGVIFYEVLQRYELYARDLRQGEHTRKPGMIGEHDLADRD